MDLLHLELASGHWALFGSGPLLVRGWVQETGDLDVVARGPAWDQAVALGQRIHLDEFDIEVVQIGRDITIGASWAIGGFDTDELIDTAEVIDGIPCVRLDHVLAYKQIAGRNKDAEHIRLILEHRDE